MWKAQKARFPHSHNHYCYCRFFSFLKHNFSFTPDLKKRVELVALKAAIEQMKQEYAFSERRACHLVMLATSTYRYQSRRSDEPLRTRLVELARAKPRFGYRRLHVLLGRSGERVNHKKTASHLSRGRTHDSTKEAQALRAHGAAAAGVDSGQPGVGVGFCA